MINPSILPATPQDINIIYHLFEEAILFQKNNNYTGWNSYDKSFIKSDIKNGLLFKLVHGNEVVCIFSICHTDALIWREKEKGDAVYLHRIVLNRKFEGQNTFQKVLDWSIAFARQRKLKYIRIDTWAANEKLIAYYKTYGFAGIENYTTPDAEELPAQHRNLEVALLELPVRPVEPQKRIYIIGAGAIGKALAAFLKKEGKDVIIIHGSINNKPARRQKIKVELNNEPPIEAMVEVSTLNHFATLDGIVILANKSFGNAHLAEKLQSKTASPIVILQNGLNIEQAFIDRNFPQVYRSVLFATSQPLSQNALRFKPAAASPVGIIEGDTTTLSFIVQEISSSHFQFRAEENIQPVIWTKAIINSAFNSICPLLETDNGIFSRNQHALDIAKRVITEGVAIARYSGIDLHTDNVINSLLMISKSTSGQLISTYQDIKNKRKTEIETLNFSIGNIADELKKENAAKEIKLLGELTKLKAELASALHA